MSIDDDYGFVVVVVVVDENLDVGETMAHSVLALEAANIPT